MHGKVVCRCVWKGDLFGILVEICGLSPLTYLGKVNKLF